MLLFWPQFILNIRCAFRVILLTARHLAEVDQRKAFSEHSLGQKQFRDTLESKLTAHAH
jgi:hypothetical protein